MHWAAAVQDTPLSDVPVASAGVLSGWTAHTLPFHRSAVAEPGKTAPGVLDTVPTAVQLLPDTHEIPVSDEFQVAPGRRRAWMDHALPSHSSASAWLRRHWLR